MKTLKNQGILRSIFVLICALLTSCDHRTRIESQSGDVQEVLIEKGKQFCIVLPEDHTTGYLWFLNQNFNKSGRINYMNAVYHSKCKGYIEHTFETKDVAYAEMDFYLIKYRDTLQHKVFKVKVQ